MDFCDCQLSIVVLKLSYCVFLAGVVHRNFIACLLNALVLLDCIVSESLHCLERYYVGHLDPLAVVGVNEASPEGRENRFVRNGEIAKQELEVARSDFH